MAPTRRPFIVKAMKAVSMIGLLHGCSIIDTTLTANNDDDAGRTVSWIIANACNDLIVSGTK